MAEAGDNLQAVRFFIIFALFVIFAKKPTKMTACKAVILS
ncbi:hypothetical protein X781_7360 [Mannheimia sp. USDA-ARS-USMARC-1261]|nr:hypothetical protein X781_7360 [Mannheimia sp. USDA-ARS-USMARC-1261]